MIKEETFEIDDSERCWSLIGTWAATPSCPRLTDAIHCRNCTEFQARAKSLLNAKPPPGYLDEWVDILAEGKDKAVNRGVMVFVFRLDDEWLALPASSLKGVSRISAIHSIPGKTDNIFSGLVNLRGRLQLCFSLKSLLGMDSSNSNRNYDSLFGIRFVEMEQDGFSWVFQVDEIMDIQNYDLDQTMNIPLNVADAGSSYIKSVFQFENRTVGFLDDELIISFLKRRIL